MRTWSAEELVIRAASAAAVAIQGLIDAAGTLERITRPPRRDFDEDAAEEFLRDGAEELAEREAEEECSEPRLCGGLGCDTECCKPTDERDGADASVHCPVDGGRCECDRTSQGCLAYHTAEVPNPTEPECRLLAALDCDCPSCRDAASKIPPLEDDKVAMRLGLVPDNRPVRNDYEPGLSDDELVGVRGLLQERYGDPCTCPPWGGNPSWPHLGGCPARTTSPVASATSDSGGEVASVIPPDVPSSPRPPWSNLADALVEHKPSAKGERSDVVAAICNVLAEHRHNRSVHGGVFYCHGPDGDFCGMFDDQQEWREHVAPLIAEALESHRIYVKRGPMGEPVPVELRPEMVARLPNC